MVVRGRMGPIETKNNPRRNDCQGCNNPVPMGEKKANTVTIPKAMKGGDNTIEIVRARRRLGDGGA